MPATFHVSVELLTNTNTTTVYAADNVEVETVETDRLTVFEVKVDATRISNCQIVVYVSEGTVIRNVDIRNDQCNNTGESDEACVYRPSNRRATRGQSNLTKAAS